MKLKTPLFLIMVFALVIGVSLTSAASVGTVYAADCVIPDSGPWPPCATSGHSGGGATSQSGDGCVIPPSGPWPPCASSGGSASGSDSGCVIPSSGPWPPCATSGGASGGGGADNSGCVIPPIGPWPPCASNENSGQLWPQPPVAGESVVTGARNIVHQGRGAKQSTVAVSGLGNAIASVEVVVDFTFSENACAAGGSVERGALGYALVSPSGTRVDLIDVAQLSGTQSGNRAQMRFADGAPSPIHLLSGRFAPADPLRWFDGENPNGAWTVIVFKNDWSDALCQHSVALHIVTE